MTVRRSSVICCDGCGARLEWLARYARPEGWRRLHVTDEHGAVTVADVCGPGCAARVVDQTYEEADVDELARRRRQGA